MGSVGRAVLVLEEMDMKLAPSWFFVEFHVLQRYKDWLQQCKVLTRFSTTSHA
jgi:hypothetical protein